MAKQNLVGLVVSQGKMMKTVKVRVQTKSYNKLVHKEIIKRKDYLVHDEGNLCKEGDIVRIEAIPKISARKYFAIAEIKVNKGQQFALYESLAKEKVMKENQEKAEEFITRKEEFSKVINQVDDLRKLDQLSNKFKTAATADREALSNEIIKIKEKYNIDVWPTTKQFINLKISNNAEDLTVVEQRSQSIKKILDKLLSDEYTDIRNQILTQSYKKSLDEIKPNTMKNLLRKYVLNPKNECPVPL